MFKKFKDFAFKGNVVDLAVGVIIGGAFGKIVASLVSDIITPLISLLSGGANFSNLFVILNAKGADTSAIKTIEAAQEAGFATLNYGNFIQTVIDFFIVALSIFIFISLIQKGREKLEAAKKAEEAAKEEEKTEEPPKPTTEELLSEIRDILKENK